MVVPLRGGGGRRGGFILRGIRGGGSLSGVQPGGFPRAAERICRPDVARIPAEEEPVRLDPPELRAHNQPQ